MATELTSKDTRRKKPSEARHCIVDFQNCLDTDSAVDELVTTIVSVSADGLSISGEAINSVVRRINGRQCPAGKAITFLVAGGVADVDYAISAVVQTSGGQTIDRSLTLQVRSS